MASKKSDAFNLLQMYEDDDDDDIDDAPTHQHHDLQLDQPPLLGDDSIVNSDNRIQDLNLNDTVSTPNLGPSTVSETLEVGRREKTVIVDYAHDDVAMSPEHEEGEILGTTMHQVEDLGSTRDVQQSSPMVNAQTMMPNSKVDSPQLSAQADVLQADTVNSAVKDSETDNQEGVNMSDDDIKNVDPLEKFLPPPPKEKCSDELQEKINKFLAYKRQGKSFNVEVRNRKDYRNPDFLRHAVRYQDIDEIGSCFSKDVFDPHGYDERDFYDAIEADAKREIERREQERKRSQKVEFVAGGKQAGIVGTAQKAVLPSPGISNLSSGGLQSGSADSLTREGRQNKKSKWDKVDGDRRNVLGGGQDNSSSVATHATLLSATNAGAGYAVFAQSKRREAEEKRSSDKRAERRS